MLIIKPVKKPNSRPNRVNTKKWATLKKQIKIKVQGMYSHSALGLSLCRKFHQSAVQKPKVPKNNAPRRPIRQPAMPWAKTFWRNFMFPDPLKNCP